MLVQSHSDACMSSLFHQKDGDGFQLGHFDCFVNGYGEIICSKSGLRYIFGPESIDLGPCCNPCDEDWIRILKNEDVLVFSRGYTHPCGNGLIRTAKQVIIPETQNNHSFLGVVLRERHPSSTEDATAAFLCPPFGIIKLHKFAFGYDSDISWPPVVGTRFWVTLNDSISSTRVWKVDSTANDVEFGARSAPINIPKLYLWQWNKTFNQSAAESTIPLNEIERNSRDSSNMLTSMEVQGCEKKKRGDSTSVQSNSAAIILLLEILNDQNIRDLVIERHQKAFENYITEMSRF